MNGDYNESILKNISPKTIANAKNLIASKDYTIKYIKYSYNIDTANIIINGYNIHITIENGRLFDFECQCIIGKNQIICKHVTAAILIYLENKYHNHENEFLKLLDPYHLDIKIINNLLWVKSETKFFDLIFKNTKMFLNIKDQDKLKIFNDHYPLYLKIIHELKNKNKDLKILANKIYQLHYWCNLFEQLKNNEVNTLKQIEWSQFVSQLKIVNLYFNEHLINLDNVSIINDNEIDILITTMRTWYCISSPINQGTYLINDNEIIFLMLFNNHQFKFFKTIYDDYNDPNMFLKLSFVTENIKEFNKRILKMKNNSYFKINIKNDQILKNVNGSINLQFNKLNEQCELILNHCSHEIILKYFKEIKNDFQTIDEHQLVFYSNNYLQISYLIHQLKTLKKETNIDVQIDKIFYKTKANQNHFNFKINDEWIELKVTNNLDEKTFKKVYQAFLKHKKYTVIDNEVYDIEAFNFLELQNNLKKVNAQLTNSNDLTFKIDNQYIFYLNDIFHIQQLNTIIKSFYKALENKEYEFLDENNILKDYQLYGINWMIKMLNHFHGCVLADEMGLGKTIQIIYLLDYFYRIKNETLPTLIIVPTTLVNNWINEFKKFAPHLKVKEIKGIAKQRIKIINNLENNCIYLTSYNLINYDFDYLYETNFLNIILDEGQNIKNNNCNWTKKINHIKAINKILVSGTPIENNLLDLWSIFNFILPHYLEPIKEFKNLYINNKKEDNLYELSLKVKPFILQRNKLDYLSLPNKNIKNVYIEFDKDNQKEYQNLVDSITCDLNTQANNNKIFLLSLITKLRMFCCSPELINFKNLKNIKIDKTISLIKELKECKDNKIVLFSNFSSALALLKEKLNEHKIKSLIVTGETLKTERTKIIEQFQHGDIQILLMSLKVGGVGLNLNFANNIIIFNPWWNEASELQAIDRLHRIGQKQDINIYKLIVNNSIEKNMENLKKQKIDIINKTLNNLTYEDLMNLIK